MPAPTVTELEDAMAVLHNAGHCLLGNTQLSDLEWFARALFEGSRLGAGDVRTIPWLLDQKDWEMLDLKPRGIFGGPNRFEELSESQQEMWRKLARICLFALPAITNRIANRYVHQSAALKEVWNRARKEGETKEGEAAT